MIFPYIVFLGACVCLVPASLIVLKDTSVSVQLSLGCFWMFLEFISQRSYYSAGGWKARTMMVADSVSHGVCSLLPDSAVGSVLPSVRKKGSQTPSGLTSKDANPIWEDRSLIT